jgi:hypothetical protein
MPSPINVELRGYLDFFGLKNGGQNPQQPAGFLQPTMELQRWYLESRSLEVQFSTATAVNISGFIQMPSTVPTNLGNGTGMFVPQNEIWVLLPGTTVFWTMATNSAAQGVDLTFATRGPGNLVTPMLPLGDRVGFTDSNAGIIRVGERVLKEPYWLEPGHELTIYSTGGIVGGPGNVTIAAWLRLVRLRI